jgi:ABC-type branched-subunit amino acid transport system substrate-binding protein
MRKWTKLLAVLAVLALIAAACSNEPAETTTTAGETPTTAGETTTTAGETTTTEEMMAELVGVTEEPCPGGNPDRGCIYLGVLTDESGPFAGAAPALYGGHQLFWATVNAQGGIGGAYDVAVPEDLKKDTSYLDDVMVTSYAQIAEDVAAVAQSLGTTQTLAVIPDYERDHTIASPMSWWSGWAFQERILEHGTNYCFEAMNAVDWATVAFPAAGREFSTAGIVFVPNDYGLDYAAGVKIGAEANGITVAWEQPAIPAGSGGDPTQTEAVAKIVAEPVDVVFVVFGPTDTAAIVGGAAQQLGASVPLFIGAGPSWNVALLGSPAAPAFQQGIFFQSSPFAGWDYDSTGHAKMRAAVEAAGLPANDFFVAGWISQYSIKAALESAYESGDLSHIGIETAAFALTDVDYEGMMPARSFAGDPNDPAVYPRTSFMGKYSADATTGIETIQDPSTSETGFFVGPTASDYTFTAACAG